VDIEAVGPGESLSIDGPANVKVLEGKLYVLGVEYGVGSSFTVMRGRRVIAKSLMSSKLEIIVGPEGSFGRVDGSNEVIDVWDKALSNVSLRGSVVVVLGAMDVGKTTVTTILVNKGVKEGLRVGVIDGDPGQNDIGPPTTVSSAIADGLITHLTQLRVLRSMFVNTTSVEHVWGYVLDSIVRLSDDLRVKYGADAVVVNTDGWVSGFEALKFKLELVKRLNANYVIVIRREDEASELIRGLGDLRKDVVVLPSPPNARLRDRDDRKIRREMGYSKYIMPSRDLSINLREKPIINLPLFRGLTYNGHLLSLIRRCLGPVMYLEQWGGVAVAIGSFKDSQVKGFGNVAVVPLPINWERGLLVALEDEDNYLLTLGVLRKIYYNTGKAVITVSKNFNAEDRVDHIRLGMIRLNDNFEEVEKALFIGSIESMLKSHSGIRLA
jgi:polynucleotide 5'-hydroxyl-kinase GRC3/NOL9